MVRVVALNWKEIYQNDRLALAYCGEMGTARHSGSLRAGLDVVHGGIPGDW